MSGSRTRKHSLINRAEVRRLVLALFQSRRPTIGTTRVSGKALDQFDAWLRAKVESEVHQHPSLGKTFLL
jgi:hypothetical protein